MSNPFKVGPPKLPSAKPVPPKVKQTSTPPAAPAVPAKPSLPGKAAPVAAKPPALPQDVRANRIEGVKVAQEQLKAPEEVDKGKPFKGELVRIFQDGTFVWMDIDSMATEAGEHFNYSMLVAEPCRAAIARMKPGARVAGRYKAGLLVSLDKMPAGI